MLNTIQYKSLKRITFFSITYICLVACAPQRAEFTGPKRQSSSGENAAKSDNSDLRQVLTPEGLTVRISPEQLENLGDLVARLDANTRTVTHGSYRILRHRDPVTKKLENRRQIVTGVDGDIAFYEQRNDETGALLSNGRLPLDDLSPIRKAMRSLSQERYDEMYSILNALILLRYKAFSLEESQKAELEVKNARFYSNLGVFKLLLIVKIGSAPNGSRSLTLDVQFNPSNAKPFDIVYLGYGSGKSRQSLLDVIAAGEQ